MLNEVDATEISSESPDSKDTENHSKKQLSSICINVTSDHAK